MRLQLYRLYLQFVLQLILFCVCDVQKTAKSLPCEVQCAILEPT